MVEAAKLSKTILMIDYSFPPVGGPGAQRTLGYVNHISRFGWSPVVLTVASGDASYHDPSLLSRIPSHVGVIRARSIEPARFARRTLHRVRGRKTESPSHAYAPVNRGRDGWMHTVERWMLFPDRRIGWLPFGVARVLAQRLDRKIDLIYSTATTITSHLMALILKTVWGKPWVADFQDPWTWPQSPLAAFPSSLHRSMADRLEHRILCGADQVTVTTGPIRELLLQKYPDISPEKITVIPMGFEPAVMDHVPPSRRSKLTITHLGSFYGQRSPVPFLRGLAEVFEEHPETSAQIEVLLIGRFDAGNLSEAEAVIAEHGLAASVHLRDPVSFEEGARLLMNSDVLLLVTGPGDWGRFLVPTKLFEYLGARRPILALIPEGAAARMLGESGGAVIVQPDDVQAIRDAVWTLYLAWKRGCLHIGADDSVIDKFTWAERTREFASTIDEVLQRRHA